MVKKSVQVLQISADDCKLKHPMKVNGQFLEARADAAALLQPADALLDHGTLAIRARR